MTSVALVVLDRLEETRQRWWLFSLLCGVLLAAAVSLVGFLVVVCADVVLTLSQFWLVTLFSVWISLSLGVFAGVVYRSLRQQRTVEAAARRVESAFPDIGSNLINLVMLSQDDDQSDDFHRAALSEAAAELHRTEFSKAAYQESRMGRLRNGLQSPRDLAESTVLLCGLVALLIAFHLVIPQWPSATDRVVHPWRFVPQVGALQIIDITPGDADILIGSSIEIVARIDNPDQHKVNATLYTSSNGSRESAHPMLGGESYTRFTMNIPSVAEPTDYRLRIGGTQTKVYHIGVVERPIIEEVEIRYSYPAYLSRSDEVVFQHHADLEGPEYTEAKLTLRYSTELDHAVVDINSHEIPAYVHEDRRSLLTRLVLAKSTNYTIRATSREGIVNPDPRINSIRVTTDSPPSVHLAKPTNDVRIAPDNDIRLVVRAADDNGLSEVRIELKPTNTDPSDQPVATEHRWIDFVKSKQTTLTHLLAVDPERFKPGDEFLIRAVAVDGRRIQRPNLDLEPQATASPWCRIEVIAPAVQANETLVKLDDVRGAIWAILQNQIRARVTTAKLKKDTMAPDANALIAGLAKRQSTIQQSTVALTRTLASSSDETSVVLKRALNRLATGQMVQAVQTSRNLEQVMSSELAEQLAILLKTQDSIIDVLRRLLDVVRAETADALAEMTDRPGGDLPNETQDKLRDLKEKLDQFLDQQKKVIDASENLAKRPVEDFTDEEKQLLKELAASEDDWSRFMGEVHSDLSKLPEQDFANPSMLDELVEVQTELKMAADALTKKAADIAVPLEQLGAEMAEELITNIEKWLPDTPDRERWSQEEPLTDEMKEAPMAELPGELEDLVGELMEEEEDLFDEMEDVSSSWADSIDKGAGWDAMDGPISNMSAKGVTGNRLPNTSEIGGRSGEGRQGKSSGEFVADTAVGKGGRKTPSRLTPDANVKGQVKDYSKDPVGGATGGGKESGQGGEGLEGPVLDRPEREMQRLAGKQAGLLNKAEAIDLQFQVLNYHDADLKKLISLMTAVEQDLKGGRYQSALRRRDVVLRELGSVRTHLEGEFRIRQDWSSNVPAEIQKDILGSMQDVSPLGWEELNRKYFQKLATGDTPDD